MKCDEGIQLYYTVDKRELSPEVIGGWSVYFLSRGAGDFSKKIVLNNTQEQLRIKFQRIIYLFTEFYFFNGFAEVACIHRMFLYNLIIKQQFAYFLDRE
jgi:hypothetical protein